MREREEGAALMVSPWLTPCADDSKLFNVVDIFDATAGTWSTAALSVARFFLAATSLPNAGLAIFAGGVGACFCCVLQNAAVKVFRTILTIPLIRVAEIF